MFYFKKWDKFCYAISRLDIIICTAKDILENKTNKQFIVLKHDVETNVDRALKLAAIEAKHGIKGSYYVQAYLLESKTNIKLLKEIQDLGHEVSYHYDVLDANDGDMTKAKEDFAKNLLLFVDNGFEVNTICQHGNPLKERVGYHSNRDFFRDSSVRSDYEGITDIVVNFKAKSGLEYLYISDAGYSWNIIDNPENNDRVETKPNIKLESYDEILKLLENGESIIMSTHPHRWGRNAIRIYAKLVLFKVIRTLAKVLYRMPIVKSLINRFYFLAKKI